MFSKIIIFQLILLAVFVNLKSDEISVGLASGFSYENADFKQINERPLCCDNFKSFTESFNFIDLQINYLHKINNNFGISFGINYLNKNVNFSQYQEEFINVGGEGFDASIKSSLNNSFKKLNFISTLDYFIDNTTNFSLGFSLGQFLNHSINHAESLIEPVDRGVFENGERERNIFQDELYQEGRFLIRLFQRPLFNLVFGAKKRFKLSNKEKPFYLAPFFRLDLPFYNIKENVNWSSMNFVIGVQFLYNTERIVNQEKENRFYNIKSFIPVLKKNNSEIPLSNIKFNTYRLTNLLDNSVIDFYEKSSDTLVFYTSVDNNSKDNSLLLLMNSLDDIQIYNSIYSDKTRRISVALDKIGALQLGTKLNIELLLLKEDKFIDDKNISIDIEREVKKEMFILPTNIGNTDTKNLIESVPNKIITIYTDDIILGNSIINAIQKQNSIIKPLKDIPFHLSDYLKSFKALLLIN